MINNLRKAMVLIFKKHSLPKWIVLALDTFVVFLMFLYAYFLRTNIFDFVTDVGLALKQSSFVVGVYLLLMLSLRTHDGLIRHTTIRDAFKISVLSICSSLIIILITITIRYLQPDSWLNIPISVTAVHFGFVLAALLFFRIFVKVFYEYITTDTQLKKNALIYGAGKMGSVVRDIVDSDSRSSYRIFSFIDDKVSMQGKKVSGLTVIDKEKALEESFIRDNEISLLIIAINNLNPSIKKELSERALSLGLEVFLTPSVDNWIDGTISYKNLRKINLEDLLSRDPITIDIERIGRGLHDKTILVTGAAGSIGSEIVRQVCKFKTKRLILLDQAETPSCNISREIEAVNGCTVEIVVGDVSNRSSMQRVFNKYSPDIIFHAAAYKHVPLMESNIHEAVRVNIGGTLNLAELAIEHNCSKFVMISTDKAVNPTNIMGSTKRICEQLVGKISEISTCQTQFVITRFGNVLGSNGSVVPLFTQQIETGGPITLTDPDIERYFMTIPEACQLVLEAGFMGKGGEIFVFDMGSPVRLKDMAEKLIRMAGLKPYKDIEIKIVGLRPGEKLYEELFSSNETMIQTHNPKISIATENNSNNNFSVDELKKVLDKLYDLSPEILKERISFFVPEYHTNEPVS